MVLSRKYISVLALLLFVFLYSNDFVIAQSATPPPVTRTFTVTGVVPPKVTDYQLELDTDPTGVVTVGQNEEITFKITYGSMLKYPYQMTLEAQWYLGTLVGEGLYTFDVVSYVPGSASQAEGSTVPVVNLTNRTISWNISSFPSETTDQEVTFKLKTPLLRISDGNVEFKVKARIFTSRITIPDEEVSLTYIPSDAYVPTSTPTYTPTPTGLPTQSSTTATPPPISTPTPIPLVADIKLHELDSTSAVLLVTSSKPAKITVYYGTSQYLENSVVDSMLSISKKISLAKLQPNTTYFARVRATDANGLTYITPEFFVFKTPKEPAINEEVSRRYYIGSTGVMLDSAYLTSSKQSFVFPIDTMINIVLPFEDKSPAQVYVKLVNNKVLGLNNFTKNSYHERIRLLETQEGVYSGQFLTSSTQGLYDLMIEKRQIDGDFSIEKLTQLNTVNPMKVKGEAGEPVENARISIDIWNSRTKLYESLPVESIGLTNPVKSETDGTFPFVLPNGKYKVHITSIGYKDVEESFDFSPSEEKYYPQFTMQRAPFSIFDLLRYFYEIVFDAYQHVSHYLDELYASYRFMHMSTIVGIFTLSILSLYLTAHYLTVRVEDLYIFIVKLAKKILHPFVKRTPVFTSFVEDQNGSPIHGVLAIMSPLNSPETKTQKDLTNVFGEFEFAVTDLESDYSLILRKQGYITKKMIVKKSMLTKNNHHIVLEEEVTHMEGIADTFIYAILSGIVRTFADSLLLFVIVIHTIYIVKFGILYDVPILLITLLNVVIYFELLWKSFCRRNHASERRER